MSPQARHRQNHNMVELGVPAVPTLCNHVVFFVFILILSGHDIGHGKDASYYWWYFLLLLIHFHLGPYFLARSSFNLYKQPSLTKIMRLKPNTNV